MKIAFSLRNQEPSEREAKLSSSTPIVSRQNLNPLCLLS
jgi:hypothetical protein